MSIDRVPGGNISQAFRGLPVELVANVYAGLVNGGDRPILDR
jgi:hypothetical protein